MTMRLRSSMSLAKGALTLALGLSLAGCPSAQAPRSERPEKAEKWFQRAALEYRQVALETAHDSVRHALDLVPEDEEVRLLAARVALSRLEYDEVLRLLHGVRSSAAASLRGRAHWYRGDVEKAAEELDQLLTDPDVDDGWAKSIGALAHAGAGRKPFELAATEGSVVALEMTRIAPGSAPLYVVPVEINGEPVLALVATGSAEVMLDSGSNAKPSWISMRFGRRLEVRDVPALSQDLSGLSQQLGGPIKALLGANLLRHLNVTLDFRGRQFVARMAAPPAPPLASRLDVAYLRGGGMVIGGLVGDKESPAALLVDTSMAYPVALDAEGWKKSGVDPKSLERVEAPGPELRQGKVPLLKLGTFSLPSVGGVSGPTFDRLERELEVDLDGALGSSLLGAFRVTFGEGGRVMWLEQSPPVPPPPEFVPEGTPGPDQGMPGAVGGEVPR